MSETAQQAASKARSRNQSPAPRAATSAKAGAKVVPEARDIMKDLAAKKRERDQESDAASEAGSSTAETPSGPSVWEKAGAAVVLFSVCCAVVMLAVSIATVGVEATATKVSGLWHEFSDPLEKVLVDHADLVLLLAAMTSFLPIGLLFTVTTVRAACDLKALTWWQKALMVALVSTALVLARFTEGPVRDFMIAAPREAAAWWDVRSLPIETHLIQHADMYIAGAAMITFAPFVLIGAVLVFRAAWGCRVTIVTEPEKKEQ